MDISASSLLADEDVRASVPSDEMKILENAR